MFAHSLASSQQPLYEAVIQGYGEVQPLPPGADARIRTAGLLKALRHLGMWLQPTFTLQRNHARAARFIAEHALPAAEAGHS